ncbi:hypothetical protein F5878DRAFT_619945 [Lentinula raphanica]|uniref:Uncharacterized protein n=1 Tax=Lentinula raphanica TaxID=153919 RepID=A0AA38P8J7_9AGAR|nr:hypothetical protein F5878DRAFT_619945 [Lentinula raphanica]
MYLFRIVFTWRLLAVYILYLTNQTVIAMPPRGRPPKGESTGIGEFTFQANLSSPTTSDPKFMLKTYVLGVANRDTSHDDQKADWVAVMVPEEDLTPSKPEKYFYGYQTLKSPNSDNEWHRQVKSGRKSSLNGASVIVTESLRLLRIGSVRMSPDTKGYLSTDVRKDVDKDLELCSPLTLLYIHRRGIKLVLSISADGQQLVSFDAKAFCFLPAGRRPKNKCCSLPVTSTYRMTGPTEYEAIHVEIGT